MRIRRFSAPEMRQAIKTVRDELGPDAVILSTRKLATGVEVVAAIDYDETWLEDSAASFGADGQGAAAASQGAAPQSRAIASSESSPAAAIGIGGAAFERNAADAVDSNVSFADALGAAARTRDQRRMNDVPTSFEGDELPDVADFTAKPRSARNTGGITPVLERELRFLRGLLENQVSSLAWADFGRRDPVRAGLIRRLMQLGLTRRVADPIAQTATRGGHRGADINDETDGVWRQALATLARRIPVSHQDVLESGGIVTLLGPTGVGKTTTIAKLAARFRAAHGADSVALLTTDNYRVGAESQLRTYGQLMGLPVVVCSEAQELHDAITRYHQRRLILIDTAGMSQRDIRLVEQVNVIQRGLQGHSRALTRYLVMSAATSHATLDETVTAFDGVELDGCVLTKVDEATGLGATLSVLIEHGLPITYLCDGQRVPEDLSVARAKQLVVRAVQFASRSTQPPEEALEMMYGGIAAHA